MGIFGGTTIAEDTCIVAPQRLQLCYSLSSDIISPICKTVNTHGMCSTPDAPNKQKDAGEGKTERPT